ncbi:expressed unknown protein [Seminavis robusta]|uniref:Uncharacterized protein n=1 Tax=Seminavis robusta TaxID=568900 RepID=A0A9N8DBA3_9STRA|nr:expressed unknown protein [Seminavis robusta]|eukprot:Sro6_g005500.1 n/a (124) ;mRNA; f:212297-212668
MRASLTCRTRAGTSIRSGTSVFLLCCDIAGDATKNLSKRSFSGDHGVTSDQIYMAVVRYDNNVATIPFVGPDLEAKKLHDRMTRETHKHHVYLIPTRKKSVASGPYQSLDQAKNALKDGEKPN